MAQMDEDFYAMLGVSPDSEDIVIQAAYRALMRRYHPDMNGGHSDRAQALNRAYETLRDPGRRARYDAQRRASTQDDEESAQKASSEPPPSPPPTQQSGNASEANKPFKPRQGLAFVVATGLLGLAVLTAVLIAALRGGPSNSASSDAYDQAAENISAIADTENVETEDPATSIENLAMGADGTGENVQSSDENYTIPTPTLPVSLGVGPAPALSFDDIEAGADRFVSVLRARGIWGAREYSEKCHHDVISSPSWAQADKCAAFDYAAAAIDDSVSGQSHFAVDNYFRFQAENQEQSYTAAGAPAYFLSGRLASIKRAAISTATTKLSELLADEQRQRNLAASRQASQADSPALTQNSD